jgi:prefoldin subunit 5
MIDELIEAVQSLSEQLERLEARLEAVELAVDELVADEASP